MPLVEPKPTTVPTDSSTGIISPKDTTATEPTIIGETASRTEDLTIGETSSRTEALTIGETTSKAEAATIGGTPSRTEDLTNGETSSITEALTVSGTTFKAEAATIGGTSSRTEAVTIGETSSRTKAVTIGETSSRTEAATIGETASRTEALTRGETSSKTEALTIGETASRTEALTIGETTSKAEATTIGETVSIRETTIGVIASTSEARNFSETASSKEILTNGETASTTEATAVSKTASINEATTISEKAFATETTTRIKTITTTNADVSSSPQTNITSVEARKNESIFSNQTSLPPTSPTVFESRKFCATCGNSAATVESRIVGGQEVQIGEYPWMVLVSIRFKYRSAFCGGTLIKKKWVVSAAHCFYESNYESVDLILGDHDISSNTEAVSTQLLAQRIKIHPQYDSTTLANDISLIEMSEEVTFNSRILPVCLPNVGDVVAGSLAIVTGWGTTKYGGSTSVRLQEVGVTLITNAECKKKFSGLMTITANMLCAYETGKDACQGDSGGPLVTQLPDGRWVLAGIVSFGYRCAYPNTPGVYTEVVKYVSWIEQNTGSMDC
ncbi:serine protease filzig-like [Palaemon carinicauda]|uniref:serine protease filzig-like n=1 Tax=Palaemon carinicauda TaxID=392227 RepID=UPI0035B5E54C